MECGLTESEVRDRVFMELYTIIVETFAMNDNRVIVCILLIVKHRLAI